jgi:hypothetical protein
MIESVRAASSRTRIDALIVPTKASAPHKWLFPTRIRPNSFTWKSSSTAAARIKEAVAEIKTVSRNDPAAAAEGAVRLIERLSPALQHIDSSSGAMGTAVNRAIEALVPIITCTAVCASGYSGRVGELWFTRVLPPPLTGADHVVFTSPYVLTSPDVAAWTAYLDRVASRKSAGTRAEALEQHFKWGPNRRYWLEFVFEAYSRHESGAIFLHGLPDVAESRPHSPSYRPLPARSATPAERASDVQTRHLNVGRGSLPLQGAAGDFRRGQTMKVDLSFPDRKISEAFLEFAEPLLEKEGAPPTAREAEKVLQLAATIWNAVVYDTAHGNTEWVTKLRNLIAGQPPLVALIEQMILRKRSSFGHDLRLIGEFKILEKNREWRLRAEARAPTAP